MKNPTEKRNVKHGRFCRGSSVLILSSAGRQRNCNDAYLLKPTLLEWALFPVRAPSVSHKPLETEMRLCCPQGPNEAFSSSVINSCRYRLYRPALEGRCSIQAGFIHQLIKGEKGKAWLREPDCSACMPEHATNQRLKGDHWNTTANTYSKCSAHVNLTGWNISSQYGN